MYNVEETFPFTHYIYTKASFFFESKIFIDEFFSHPKNYKSLDISNKKYHRAKKLMQISNSSIKLYFVFICYYYCRLRISEFPSDGKIFIHFFLFIYLNSI